MPIRDKFPSDYFSGNPFSGKHPHDVYREIQWGNEPRRVRTIEAPEPMAVLGEVAMLKYGNGGVQRFGEGEYFLALGTRSNFCYLVPILSNGGPMPFPRNFLDNAERLHTVVQTDYYSEKGNESGYYYHQHERPYPSLYGSADHYVLVPKAHNGGRSYAVGTEGIIG